MAISHEDLPLVISVGPQRLLYFIRYTGLRTFLCPNIPIRQSALLHTCTKGLICSQENLFAFLHIQTCISMLFFFFFSFVHHTCSASSSVHKALENVTSGEISYWMYAQILTHKKQRVPLAVTTFAYRYQISAGPPIMSGRSILLTVFSCWDSICKRDWEKLNAGVMRRDMQVHLTLHIKSNVFINKPSACLQTACSSVPSSDNSVELKI